MYAESTEILFVESTYILEHILRLVSGTQEHTDIKLAPIQCTVWLRNEKFSNFRKKNFILFYYL